MKNYKNYNLLVDTDLIILAKLSTLGFSSSCSTNVSSSEFSTILDNISDWKRLLKRASQMEVIPLIYHNLCKFNQFDKLDDDIQAILKKRYFSSLAYNICIMDSLSDLIDELSILEIPFIVLKGAGLVLTLYDDLALRQMHDLDLLIKKEDLQKIQEFMQKQDVIIEEEYYLKQRLKNDLRIAYKQYPPYNIDIEWHWRLTGAEGAMQSIELDLDLLWQGAYYVDLENERKERKILVLDYKRELLYLSIHLYGHKYEQLKHLIDIHLLIMKYADSHNWSEIIKLARDTKCSIAFYYTLLLIYNLFDNEKITEEILNELKPSRLRCYLLEKHLNADSLFIFAREKRAIMHYWVRFLMIQNVKDLIHSMIWLLFPSQEWLIRHYLLSSSPSFIKLLFYHCFHPFILFWNYLRNKI